MNTKNLEGKNAHSKKDDAAAVYVLPPHLLQQLGINLESIECTQNRPSGIEAKDVNVVKKPYYPESGKGEENESSILKTASLIKNTVLLSPTFIPTVANTIAGEVEISNITKELETEDICRTYRNPEKKCDTKSTCNNGIPLVIKEVYINRKIQSQTNIPSPFIKYNMGHVIQAGINNNLPSDINNSSNKNIIPAQQLLHEINDNLETNNAAMFNNQRDKHYYCNGSELKGNIENKVNIPCYIASSDLQKNNRPQDKNDKLCNVLNDNVILSEDGKHFNNTLEVNGNNKDNSKLITQPYGTEDQVNTMCKDINKDIDIPKIVPVKGCEEDSYKTYNKMPESTEYCDVSDHVKNISAPNKLLSNGCSNVCLDMVNSYHIRLTGEKGLSLNLCNNNSISSDNSVKELNGSVNASLQVDRVDESDEHLTKSVNCYINRTNMEKLKTTQKANVIESKLCIQGVEKPGGFQKMKNPKDSPLVVKTYSRNKQRQIITSTLNSEVLLNTMQHSVTTESQYENDINTVNNITDSLMTKEFCICDDFGQMCYYDNNNGLYEHIHFWNHKSISCNPDVVLSMYDDNYSHEIDTTVMYDEHLDEMDIDLCPHKICWKDLKEEEYPKNIKVPDHEMESITSKVFDQHDVLHSSCFGVQNVIGPFVSPQLTESNVTSRKSLEKNEETEPNVKIVNNIVRNQVTPAKEINKDICKENNKSETAVIEVGQLIENEVLSNETICPKPVDIYIDIEKEAQKRNSLIGSKVNEGFRENVAKSQIVLSEKNYSNVQTSVPKEKTNMQKAKGTNDIFEDIISSHISLKNIEIDKDFGEKKDCSSPIINQIAITNGEFDDNAKNNDKVVTLPQEIPTTSNVESQSKPKKSADTKDVIDEQASDVTIPGTKNIEQPADNIAPQNMTEDNSRTAKKRKSNFSSTNTETSSVPQCNKNIKCGLCNQVQTEAEWGDHVENKHCCIAWEADQTINLNDAKLSLKLKKRLKNVGELECTFCGNKQTHVKQFLTHVQTCLETFASSKDKIVKCGVCKTEIKESCWMEHIAEHNYVAWKESEPPLILEDEFELKEYLLKVCKENGSLVCSKCRLNRKYVQSYMNHVKKCVEVRNETSASNSDMNTTIGSDIGAECESSPGDGIVKCAVCHVNVKTTMWIKHIGKEHNYLAWVDGTPPLDINNDLDVQNHLKNISKQHGGLYCGKCGLNRRYVKKYLQHIQICDELTESQEDDTDILDDGVSRIFEVSLSETIDKDPLRLVECGVCHAEVQSCDWITHIQSLHNYKAWIQGQPVLNLTDVVMVRKYMSVISKRNDGLICQICGMKTNDPRTYMKHIETCKRTSSKYVYGKTPSAHKDDDENASGTSMQYKVEIDIKPICNSGEYQCAICFKNVKISAWNSHAMKQHYNLAWPVGDTPIDLKKPYEVERYIKEYRKHNKLVCKVCGISRASCVGFYAHILVCGKTEEEVNTFKEHCDICNNSYLCIYKSQHMTAHREQEYAKERKLNNEKEQVKKKKTEEVESPSGRRRAAEKARTVIQKYNTNMKEGSHTCPSCNFGMDSKEELESHKCVGSYLGYSSDSDVSVKLEQCSDDDDADDDDLLDSDENISNEEEEVVVLKKKRHRESLPPAHKIPRIPFKVSHPDAYLRESSNDFYEMHFTSEVLYNDWRNSEYESVPESELGRYLPPLEKSCKVKFGNDSWTTYDRFEAQHGNGWTLFTGACIQCVCWAPPRAPGAAEAGHYLAAACHSDVDVPRYNYDQVAQHANAIQIWNIGDFKTSLPKFVFGISHDYGTVWAMDWCPSGSRDVYHQNEAEAELRLGLLAVACSDGYAYIFSVPYPSSVTQKHDNVFYKLKPAVELRATMNANRKIYQATSICWSPQKGHATVVVGYADGTTAFYDLNSDSPILRSNINDTTIIYPYEDNRPQNSCITDVGVYPSALGAGGAGAVCNASAGGAGARAGRGGRALHAHVAAARAAFAPHWPAVLLAGDDYIVNLCVNEVELCGSGRRLGGARGWSRGGAAGGGAAAVHAPPLLRLMRTHPAYGELHKPVIGMLQMVPIGKKRKRKNENDELAVTLEPTTYEAAIQKFGIEYTIINQRDKNEQQKAMAAAKERWIERFPLSDVSSMAFCLPEKHQNKLAVALHAGFIFIVKV